MYSKQHELLKEAFGMVEEIVFRVVVAVCVISIAFKAHDIHQRLKEIRDQLVKLNNR
jgi:hypothetical protein